MRFLNLLVILNLFLCTTGLYSVTDLFANEPTKPNCHDHSEGNFHILDHDSIDLEIIATHAECYDCCLDILQGSNDWSNSNSMSTVINFLPPISSENNCNARQFLSSVFTKRPHGPPDIYRLHSSYLL